MVMVVDAKLESGFQYWASVRRRFDRAPLLRFWQHQTRAPRQTGLTSLEEFEDHYNARPTASCSVCSRVHPTLHLLNIHVSEAHDSFFLAKVARGYHMYECLVKGCGSKLKSYKIRQQHLVDKHKFPTSFEFYKMSHPSKKHRQKNQCKQLYRIRKLWKHKMKPSMALFQQSPN